MLDTGETYENKAAVGACDPRHNGVMDEWVVALPRQPDYFLHILPTLSHLSLCLFPYVPGCPK